MRGRLELVAVRLVVPAHPGAVEQDLCDGLQAVRGDSVDLEEAVMRSSMPA